MTVMAYICAERALVSRVRITFQACVAKLAVEQTAASDPTQVTVSTREAPSTDSATSRERPLGSRGQGRPLRRTGG